MLWFTGLSAAGKTTLARQLDDVLKRRDVRCCVLDGDDLRQGLNADLGFSEPDRIENTRRVGEVAKLFLREGYLAIVAMISPLRSQRATVRALFTHADYIEVFVDAPLATCEARDPKGLYQRARANEIKEFTGIDAPYEPPLDAELHLHTDREAPTVLVDAVITYLEEHEILS